MSDKRAANTFEESIPIIVIRAPIGALFNFFSSRVKYRIQFSTKYIITFIAFVCLPIT